MPEPGHESVRSLGSLVVSALARVEVPAAVWRKHRLGELPAPAARTLCAAFASDLGTRLAAVAVADSVLERAAALLAVHRLRASDAVQLASALVAREAVPELSVFACFDERLRDTAAAEGLAPLP